MTKNKTTGSRNPFINALGAALYIVVVACIMYYGLKENGKGESVLIPIAILSLFTLSAAVMGYLFLSEPIQMYLDGKKKEAIRYFVMTLLSFAAITALVFLALFLKTLLKN